MAVRVAAADVKKVITTTIADAVVDDTMIAVANLIVDEHLLDAGHSEDMLTKIELYLAAHFVALTEEGGGITRAKMGDASEGYSDVYEAGFKSTRFGQTALALDSSGVLTSLATNKLRAEFRVL